jgi:hypothetical protein
MALATPERLTEKLKDYSSRWRAACRAGDTGYLIIARDVLDVANRWETYRAEADGKECTTWLRAELGPGKTLDWFRKRQAAVDALGEDVRRWMHHEVAIWLVAKVTSPDERDVAKRALSLVTRQQKSNPLTKAQAYRVVAGALGWKKDHVSIETCARCAELEEILRANGIAMPGRSEANSDESG